MRLNIFKLLDRPDCLNPESQREILRLVLEKAYEADIKTIIVYLLQRISELEDKIDNLEHRVVLK